MPRIHAMYKQVPFANSLIDVIVVCNKSHLGITFLYNFSFIRTNKQFSIFRLFSV